MQKRQENPIQSKVIPLYQDGTYSKPTKPLAIIVEEEKNRALWIFALLTSILIAGFGIYFYIILSDTNLTLSNTVQNISMENSKLSESLENSTSDLAELDGRYERLKALMFQLKTSQQDKERILQSQKNRLKENEEKIKKLQLAISEKQEKIFNLEEVNAFLAGETLRIKNEYAFLIQKVENDINNFKVKVKEEQEAFLNEQERRIVQQYETKYNRNNRQFTETFKS